MKWLRSVGRAAVTDCGRYEITGSYHNGHFAWRGREVSTDHLVQSSADRGFVQLCCERHATAVNAEARA